MVSLQAAGSFTPPALLPSRGTNWSRALGIALARNGAAEHAAPNPRRHFPAVLRPSPGKRRSAAPGTWKQRQQEDNSARAGKVCTGAGLRAGGAFPGRLTHSQPPPLRSRPHTRPSGGGGRGASREPPPPAQLLRPFGLRGLPGNLRARHGRPRPRGARAPGDARPPGSGARAVQARAPGRAPARPRPRPAPARPQSAASRLPDRRPWIRVSPAVLKTPGGPGEGGDDGGAGLPSCRS